MSEETIHLYIQLTDTMTRESFVEEYNHPFLVQHVAAAPSRPARPHSRTTKIRLEDIQLELPPEPASQRENRVHAVRARRSSTPDGSVMVGRTEENDIILSSDEVSKDHARISHDPLQDLYTITDQGSTNGTSLNGERLAVGKPRNLIDGDIVSFSSADDYQFYLSPGFYDFLIKQKR